MDQFSKFVITLFTIISYFTALLSAIFAFPYVWLPMGILLTLLGLYWLYKYTHRNRGVLAIALFTNGTFISLGQYLETIVPAISILVNILGAVLTIFMMLVWYYWKEGQKHVEVRIKQEAAMDPKEEISAVEKIKICWSILKRQRQLVKKKNYSKWLAFQFAYVEYQEEIAKKAEKNALDFVLGKEVILQRNEYDQSPQK